MPEYNRLCDELNGAKNALKNVPPQPQEPQKTTVDHPDRNKRGVKIVFWGIALGIISAIILSNCRSYSDWNTIGGFMMGFGVLLLVIGFALVGSSTEEKVPTEAEINEYNNAIATRNAHISQWNAKVAELETKIANCDYMKALQYFFTNFTSWKAEIDNCYKQLSY
jgi:hypothetical protein